MERQDAVCFRHELVYDLYHKRNPKSLLYWYKWNHGGFFWFIFIFIYLFIFIDRQKKKDFNI